MADQNQQSPSQGIKLGDVYFVLFRRKWMILFFSFLGLAAATALYFTLPRLYKSQAKVLIRYIVERKSMTSPDDEDQVKSTAARGDYILNSELQILNSFDLFEEVARTVTPERILGTANVDNPLLRAAAAIANGLKTEVMRNSSIIQIEFVHPDPQLVQTVVSNLVKSYEEKHIAIHRDLGAPEQFLQREKDDMSSRIAKIESDIRDLKAANNIISVEETKQAIIRRITGIQEQLLSAEAELEQRKAALGGLSREVAETNQPPQSEIAEEVLTEYLNHVAQLKALQKIEIGLWTKYTEKNSELVRYQELIKEKKNLLREMEAAHPQLAGVGVASAGTNSLANIAQETVTVGALEARIRYLTSQLLKVQAEATQLDGAATEILRRERDKMMLEEKYKFYTAALDQANVDTALGPGKAPNINVVQEPTPAIRESSERKKIMGLALAGFMAAGIGLAFLLELYLDPSIKRPSEVQSKAHLPLMLTIPRITRRVFKKAARAAKKATVPAADAFPQTIISYSDVSWKNGRNEIPPWDPQHPLQSYFEALRDQLITHFELKNMTHKPKLVALTGCSHGAGVSTLAAGLAASLSETGGGNVLLVDMNAKEGAAHEIHKGKPGPCGLPDALEAEKRSAALVQENLYVASGSQSDDRLPRVLPRRFTHLVPKMKASDYDYIIFDMPPVDQTAITARLAGFMDIVFLVVESEKTHRGLAKRANSLLAQSNANVTSILNQYKNYVPKTLDQEF